MNPKSHKIFKEEVAKEVGVHENVVDDLVSFYYGKVRKALSSLDQDSIFLDGLGTFKIRKTRLEKNIKKYKSALGNIVTTTYSGYEKKLSIQSKIDKMENLLDKVNTNIENKKRFKEDRKNGFKKDLEK